MIRDSTEVQRFGLNHSVMLRWIAKFEKHPDPAACCEVDYKSIYMYLASLTEVNCINCIVDWLNLNQFFFVGQRSTATEPPKCFETAGNVRNSRKGHQKLGVQFSKTGKKLGETSCSRPADPAQWKEPTTQRKGKICFLNVTRAKHLVVLLYRCCWFAQMISIHNSFIMTTTRGWKKFVTPKLCVVARFPRWMECFIALSRLVRL